MDNSRGEMYLYECLCVFPNTGVKDLSKKMGWSKRKINRYAKKLLKAGLIRKVYKPKKVGEMINWEEMENTKSRDW